MANTPPCNDDIAGSRSANAAPWWKQRAVPGHRLGTPKPVADFVGKRTVGVGTIQEARDPSGPWLQGGWATCGRRWARNLPVAGAPTLVAGTSQRFGTFKTGNYPTGNSTSLWKYVRNTFPPNFGLAQPGSSGGFCLETPRLRSPPDHLLLKKKLLGLGIGAGAGAACRKRNASSVAVAGSSAGTDVGEDIRN